MPEVKQPSDRRPPARKTTASSDKRRKAILDQDYTLRIDGVDYTIVPADFTGRVEAQIRRETGMSVLGIIEALEGEQTGIDLLGYFMWAVRLGRGDVVTLDEVLDSISFASEVETVKATAPKGSA